MAGGQVDGLTSKPQIVQAGSLNSLVTGEVFVLDAETSLVMGVSHYILPEQTYLLGP